MRRGRAPVTVPDDTVVHQVPVCLPGGKQGRVVRVYGVSDDSNDTVASGNCTWFGRPVEEVLAELGIEGRRQYGARSQEKRSLWNARLFPLGTVEAVWACAVWMMGVEEGKGAQLWRQLERLSLAESTRWVDRAALTAAHQRRRQAQWQATAVTLASEGGDVAPLLVHAPGVAVVASTGRALLGRATDLVAELPTEAASRFFQASLFLGHAGSVEAGQRHKRRLSRVCVGQWKQAATKFV